MDSFHNFQCIYFSNFQDIFENMESSLVNAISRCFGGLMATSFLDVDAYYVLIMSKGFFMQHWHEEIWSGYAHFFHDLCWPKSWPESVSLILAWRWIICLIIWIIRIIGYFNNSIVAFVSTSKLSLPWPWTNRDIHLKNFEKKTFTYNAMEFTTKCKPAYSLNQMSNPLRFDWTWKLRWQAVKVACDTSAPGSNFFGKTPLFFRYSGVNAANAVNLQAKRR